MSVTSAVRSSARVFSDGAHSLGIATRADLPFGRVHAASELLRPGGLLAPEDA